MGWFIFSILFILGAVGVIAGSIGIGRKLKAGTYSTEKSQYNSDPSEKDKAEVVQFFLRVGGGILVVLAGLFFAFSTVYSQGVGEARVIVNLDGTVAGENIKPGFGFKAPWQDTVDFDLFSQEVLYAGGDTAPSYSGGQVSGKEITVSVGGINGGSTQANADVSVTYSVDAAFVGDIYADFKSQERFTKQVIEKTILSTIRQVPSQYSAVEFRGEKRQEATDAILDQLNAKLNKLGVTVDFVNIQDVRYPEEVEAALKAVETANQNAQKAEADQRTAEVEAETKRIVAQGVADANEILNVSLTPEILQQQYIEALKAGTVFVVPEGSTPLVGTK